MPQKAPGKGERNGISIIQLFQMFPDDQTAHDWLVEQRWGQTGRSCPHCGGCHTTENKNNRFWCPDCRNRFSVKTGTAMEASKISLQKWVIAIYLCATSLKSVSSMKLHRDLGITQKSAWFMMQRLREAWSQFSDDDFEGPVEADETYFGGKRKNMSNAKRKELRETQPGRGAVGKIAVVGVKDRETNRVRAKVVETTDAETLQGFVEANTNESATVYTDEARAYKGIARKHEAVCHSVHEYVRGMAHTNGMESFWSMLKRAHEGTFHKISPKHLQRYVDEFAGRHNIRGMDTLDQMTTMFAGMVGKRLMYKQLTA